MYSCAHVHLYVRMYTHVLFYIETLPRQCDNLGCASLPLEVLPRKSRSVGHGGLSGLKPCQVHPVKAISEIAVISESCSDAQFHVSKFQDQTRPVLEAKPLPHRDGHLPYPELASWQRIVLQIWC